MKLIPPRPVQQYLSDFFKFYIIFFRRFLREVSRDLFFGACHFCTFDIADLADFTPKFPEKIAKFDEENDKDVVILDRNLEEVRELLKSLGLPNFLLRKPSRYLKLSHSRAGRPGLEVTSEIPDFLSKMIPFEEKDIILTIDTISAVDTDRLLLQLQNKVENGVFNVEIERAGKLKLLRVSK